MELRRQLFGVKSTEYLDTLRDLASMYKSKKDFYQSFLQLTGMTPTRFRRLAPERALDIIEAIRLRIGNPRFS